MSHHPDMAQPLPASTPATLTDTLKDRVQVLLVTVNQVEWEAVYKKLKPVDGEDTILKVHPNKDAYMIGTFGVYCAALLQSAAEGARTAQSVSEALRWLEPKATILVGTGFGLNHEVQRVGDVVVSQSLAAYDLEKVRETKSIDREVATEGGTHLFSLFHPSNTYDWRFGKSKVHVGAILSGSTSPHIASFKEMKQRSLELFGGTTEGPGVYHALKDSESQWIVIKGVERFESLTKGRKDRGSSFAAAAATSLVLHVLSKPDILSDLGCVAEGTGNSAWQSAKNRIPDRYEVFISHCQQASSRKQTAVDALLKSADLGKYCQVFYDNCYHSLEHVEKIDCRHLALMEVDNCDVLPLLDLFRGDANYPFFMSCSNLNVKSAAEEIRIKLLRRLTRSPFYDKDQSLELDDLREPIRRSNYLLMILSNDFSVPLHVIAKLVLAFKQNVPIVSCIVNAPFNRDMVEYWDKVRKRVLHDKQVLAKLGVEVAELEEMFQHLRKSWIFGYNTDASLTDKVSQVVVLEEALNGKVIKQLDLEDYDDFQPIVKLLQSKGWHDIIPRLVANGVVNCKSEKFTTLTTVKGCFEMGIPGKWAESFSEEMNKLKQCSLLA